MDNFIVSALKYRPSTFDSVVGQPAITSTLKNAIKNDHLAHAYLFCGPRGVGKTTCARIFAKTLNCSNRTAETEACNECESCVSFNEERSFNIHELDAASNNSVENIRSLIDQIRIPPQIGKYSLYIIDEVHMLSTQAFNAFLKTLEEPPKHAIFILATTEKHKIIPTILSRCQIFDFYRISIKDIIQHLQLVAAKENVEVDEEGLNIIAQKADGSMRDALSIFDQIVSFTGNNVKYEQVIENLNVLDYEYYFKMVDSFLQVDYKQSMILYNEILEKGFDGHNFISGLAKHLRDLLVSKDPQTIDLLDTGDKLKERYKSQASMCALPFIYAALKICNTCDVGYKSSKNYRLHVEIALLQLSNLLSEKKKVSPESTPEKEDRTPEKPEPKKVIEKSGPDKTVPTKVSANQQDWSENREEKRADEEESPKGETVEESKQEKASVEASPDVGKEQSEVLKEPDQQEDKFQKPSIKDANGKTSISVKDAFKLVNSKENFTNGNGEAETEEEEIPDEPEESEEFTVADVEECWLKYAEKLNDEKRLYAMMTAAKPSLRDGYVVFYPLKNATQLNEIKEIKPRLLNFLRKTLKNSTIELEFNQEKEDKQEDKKKRLYTDEDKYKYMSEKNPNLEKLRQKLNLDFT